MAQQAYLCSKCQEEYDEEDLIRRDVGGSEEAFGSSYHKPCWISITPCCGLEPEEQEKSWWKR